MAPIGTRFFLRHMAKQGAAVLFATVVARIYEELTGEDAKAPVFRLLERLRDENLITPEASLHLMATARALEHAGAHLAGLGRPFLDVLPEQVRATATELRDRLVAAPEGFDRLVRFGKNVWNQDPQWWKG